MEHGKASIVIVCLFILLTIIGLFTVDGYGAPYDELVEMIILRSNAKEYALRLEGEDSQSFFATLPGTRISRNIERDHGLCAYYPLIPFLSHLQPVINQYSTVWSILTWLWFMVGCLSLYGLMRQMNVSRLVSFAAVLLLYLSPRFFAEGHYNNKDVVLLCLFLLTLWQGARFLHKPVMGRGLLFSFAGAMATNIKIVGILPWSLIGLAALVWLSVNHRWSRKMLGVACGTLLSYAFFYLLLTPAMWENPMDFIRYVIANATGFTRFGGVVIFRGADFYDIGGSTPLPWYYLPYYMMVSIPLYTVILSAFGQLRTFHMILTQRADALKNKNSLLLLVVSLAWLLPMIFCMVMKPLMYNGWRHFYFVYAGFVIMAGFGLNTLWEYARPHRKRRTLIACAMASCYCLTGIGLVLNHPFQFAYFNPLVPRDAQYRMDMDTWNVGPAGAFTRLYKLKEEEDSILRVGCYFNDIKIGAFKLPSHIRDRLVVTAEWDEPYLYYGSTYAHIYWVKEPPEGYRTLFKVQSYGNTLGVMYERDE